MRVLARCGARLGPTVTGGSTASRTPGLAGFEQEYRLKLTDIQRDIAEGGVRRDDSTPAHVIHGVRPPSGSLPPELFELAITLELSPTP